MSLDAMRWAKQVKTGRAAAKSVLTWLADMCGADLTAYPSISALAEATELDRKTVQSSLQYLVEKGFIEDTGERRGKTKQIPVYRLLGVDESIADAERTQKRDCLNQPKNGCVKPKAPKNGCVKNDQTIPFFPSNDPKNGIRNPPKESKYINPTHNARESAPTSWAGYSPQPVVTGKPDNLSEPVGKFPMAADWQPSLDFRQRAATWGVILPEPGYSPAELTAFRDYWIAEGKAFAQVQWEQKFARSLQHRPPANTGKSARSEQVPHWNSPEGWENFL